MIKVFIGFDEKEPVVLPVLMHSIHTRTTQPISFTPVSLKNLTGILTRERHPKQSNDFAFSRFLVPWMCGYKGWAIFMDGDMVVKDDIAKLWALRDEHYAVRVVKHNHIPKEDRKYLGNEQTRYDRKNWSSVMLMNCAKCKVLTPEYINVADGLELHQFRWLDDDEIGELPKQWNHLVGYDQYDPKVCNIHYTTGGPYFEEYRNCDYHQDWWSEHTRMNFITR